MQTDKFELIRRLEYRAHVLDNASRSIQQLQNHIADIDVKVSRDTANDLYRLVDAIDEADTVSQIETATYTAEQRIYGLTEEAEPNVTVDKQDLLWRTRSRVNLLDGIAEQIRKVEHGLSDIEGETTDKLDEGVLDVEEADDIAVLQTAVMNTEHAVNEHLQQQG